MAFFHLAGVNPHHSVHRLEIGEDADAFADGAVDEIQDAADKIVEINGLRIELALACKSHQALVELAPISVAR